MENRPYIGVMRLTGWRVVWYGRIVRLPFIFYPLAWLNCSVPGTRRRLDRLLHPHFSVPPSSPTSDAHH